MRKALALAGFFALGAYGWLLANHAQGVASGADNSGYMNAARLFLAGKIRENLRLPQGMQPGQFRPWLFTPLGFSPSPDGKELVPFYPPGLSATQALFAVVTGSIESAAQAVNVFCGVLLVFFTYRLGRALGLSPAASLGGSLLLAANPVTVRFFTWNMSDGPATTWAVAAVYFAVRSQKKPGFAALAGFFFALGAATRPTNALLLPVLAYTLWRRSKAQLFFALGASPFLGALFFYNHLQYGAFWRTGYGAMAREFKLRYFLPTLLHYGAWMGRFFSPLALVPFVAHVLAIRRRQPVHFLLALWWLPFFGFYAFYKYTNDTWWYLRFVLPAFPALILAGVAAFSERQQVLAERFSRRGAAALAALMAAVALSTNVFWLAKLRVFSLSGEETVYRQAVHWVCSQTPENSLLFASQLSGAFYFYSSRGIVRHDLVTSRELTELLRQREQGGFPAYMALFDFEAETFTRRNPGLVEPSANLGRVLLLRFLQTPDRAVPEAISAPPPRRPSVIPDGKRP